MPRLNNPTVLLTRPKASSDAFVAELSKIAGAFEPLISPAFEIVATDAPVIPFEMAIFTSRAGVVHAPNGLGRLAYCVGEATAKAAHLAGYNARSAQGGAPELIAMILREQQHAALLHFRGEVSYGNIRDTLNNHGLTCSHAIVYRKSPCAPSRDFILGSRSMHSRIICLFSAETVSIIAEWPIEFSGLHVVAISQNVADAAQLLKPSSVTVSNAPTLGEMAAATSRLIA